MKKIIIMIKPFSFTQQFCIYENGNKIETDNVKLDDIPKKIIEAKEKYNVEQIELIGSKKFSEGISKRIKEEELVKYNSNSLEINIK